MSPQVKLLRESGADAVIIVGVYGPSSAFIRDSRMSGWNIPIANLSFVGASTMLEKLIEASKDLGKDLTQNLVNSQVVPSPDDVRYPLVAEYRAHTAAKDRHLYRAGRLAECSRCNGGAAPHRTEYLPD